MAKLAVKKSTKTPKLDLLSNLARGNRKVGGGEAQAHVLVGLVSLVYLAAHDGKQMAQEGVVLVA